MPALDQAKDRFEIKFEFLLWPCDASIAAVFYAKRIRQVSAVGVLGKCRTAAPESLGDAVPNRK